MSSTSPGHVITARNAREHPQDTLIGVQDAVQLPVTVARVAAQKRGRDSPTTPSRSGAMTLFNNLTDSVRTSAVRGLRALTDTIERGRDSASESSSSGPTSPTIAHRTAHTTPAGKRRRTVRTEERLRDTHADWRGAHWDYTSAMAANLFQQVADQGPSDFAFPSVPAQIGMEVEELDTQERAASPLTARPSSAMSAASAPAVLSTPQSHHRRTGNAHSSPVPDSGGGWITSYMGTADDDPFAMGVDADTRTDGSHSDDGGTVSFVQAMSAATALLSADEMRTPDACGAIHAFISRLHALDTQGNFATHNQAGEGAVDEMRAMRDSISALETAQRATTDVVRQLAASYAAAAHNGGATPPSTRPAASENATGSTATTPIPARTRTTDSAPAPVEKPGARSAPSDATQEHAAREVGRHDERRAVFNPATPFGGRHAGAASPDALRHLNGSSYLVRDAINTALRDWAVAQMQNPADTVQVIGVNWTERGNLCVVVSEGFTATQLLVHADIVATAAQLGDKYSASRDVPVFKAVLCNVPTKRTDGSLFSEADVLADLCAHSSAFYDLKRAESAEPARWISSTNVRTLKPRSTLLINFATEGDAAKFLAMHRRLYVFGCMCEPNTFQPRDKERICTRCWNPLARHRERDAVCEERCRLCGGKHAEEDHACTECDVLAKPCAHIGLRCVNCKLGHAADDSACEVRRRMRGTSYTGPPMSTRTPGGKASRPKKGKVRILGPDEPFPDDTPDSTGADADGVREAAPRRGKSTGRVAAPVGRRATATGQEPSLKRTEHAPATGQEPARTRTRTRGKTAATGQEPPSTDAVSAPATGQELAQPRSTTAATGQELPSRTTTAPVTGQEPAPVTAPTTATGQEPSSGTAEEGEPDEQEQIVEADRAALGNLLGEACVHRPNASATPPTRTSYADAAAGTESRRTSSTRIAASTAGKDDKRRRAAHVLARSFKFLNQKDAMAALKARADDYVSTVSWAADEQSKRGKPDMQGKSADSLRRIVDEMKKADTAPEHPDASTSNPRAYA